EQEIPASPGRAPHKQGFLSRFLSKATPHEPPPIPSTSAGRITPESRDRSDSFEKHGSRDNSPKSPPVSLASSTYRSFSQSLTDLAAMTSRSKPSSPDIDPIHPPPLPHSSSFGSELSPPPTVPDKVVQLPFRLESIQRQGWLNKRPDSEAKRSTKPSTSVWKLQRAVVHDSKLYLYNPPSSLGIKAFSPTATPTASHTPSPKVSLSHIKHFHSPSEASGLSAQASSGQVSEDIGRRPSTAPHQL